MEYHFKEIEKRWQEYWQKNNTYKVNIDLNKPKYYVLDMFPYPSGAGLHVGHPLGYIASDVFSRYKRLKGYNVLHPMGFDAYGLPAEQYAIQTGQHPAITTEVNINRYKEQLGKLGFCFDWSREVKTCDPNYYKWTQHTFIQLFNHYFDNETEKAEPISKLINTLDSNGNLLINACCTPETPLITANEWKAFSDEEKQLFLLNYRLAYLSETMVNWCPQLGTVLANDEVKDGLSVRGGYLVERKKMKQWSLRISAYAQRLLEGLDMIDWSESIKDVQKNWIGKSEGAEIEFEVCGINSSVKVFTTRPDTIFGVSYVVFAPEHELVPEITSLEQKNIINEYILSTKNRTELDRLADAKTITGVFTGAYAIHPFTKEKLPIWIADYVLAGYGTGVVMAVPAHDSRDYAFAKNFNLPINRVVEGGDLEIAAYVEKQGKIVNSDFINGLDVKDAIKKVIEKVTELKIGIRKVNFKIRDAIFSRQRYWGEPFPVYYKNEIPYMLDESNLPLQLPDIDKYLPTEKGEPPLGRAKNWQTKDGYPLEFNTMPGFAGSSAYYIRYMDPTNNNCLVSEDANKYWQDVDLYIGGMEHATGHLIYARFWNKFLYDIGTVCKDEPFKKLINQGMIQGRSNFVYRIKGSNKFVSYNLRNNYETTAIHVDVNIVSNDILDTEKFKNWLPEYSNAEFVLENDGKYYCGYEVEKMSKSLHNVVNPDYLVERYGADTLRLYEMFLGPLEQHKPWDTNGIEGVSRFMKKLWRLYHDSNNNFYVEDNEPTKNELTILHKTIKKYQDDIERYSFNTIVSTFMICVNELNDVKCKNKSILSELAILVSTFAPHIAEELWLLLGNKNSVLNAAFPIFNGSYLIEDSIEYPVSFNGKTKFKIEISADATVQEIEKIVLENDKTKNVLQGNSPKKVIVVPKRIINIVM